MWWRESDWRDYVPLSDDPSVARLAMTAAAHSGPPLTTVGGGLAVLEAVISAPEVVEAFHRAGDDDAFPGWAVDSLNAYEATAKALIARGLPEQMAANRARLVFGSPDVDPDFIKAAANAAIWPEELAAAADESLTESLSSYAREPVAKDFDENEVERDAKGRFAEEGDNGERIDGYTEDGQAYQIINGRAYAVQKQKKRTAQVQEAAVEERKEAKDIDTATALQQLKASRDARNQRNKKNQGKQRDARAARAAEAAKARAAEAARAQQTSRAGHSTAQSASDTQQRGQLAAHRTVDRQQLQFEAFARKEQRLAQRGAEMMRDVDARRAERLDLPRNDRYTPTDDIQDPFESMGILSMSKLGVRHPSEIPSGEGREFTIGNWTVPTDIKSEDDSFDGPVLTNTMNSTEIIDMSALVPTLFENVSGWMGDQAGESDDDKRQFLVENPNVPDSVVKHTEQFLQTVPESAYVSVQLADDEGETTPLLMTVGELMDSAVSLALGQDSMTQHAYRFDFDGPEPELVRAEVEWKRKGGRVDSTIHKSFDESEVKRDEGGRFAPEGVRIINGRAYAVSPDRAADSQEQQVDTQAQERAARDARIARSRRAAAARGKRRAARPAAVQTASEGSQQERSSSQQAEQRGTLAAHRTVDRAALQAVIASRKAAQSDAQVARQTDTQKQRSISVDRAVQTASRRNVHRDVDRDVQEQAAAPVVPQKDSVILLSPNSDIGLINVLRNTPESDTPGQEFTLIIPAQSGSKVPPRLRFKQSVAPSAPSGPAPSAPSDPLAPRDAPESAYSFNPTDVEHITLKDAVMFTPSGYEDLKGLAATNRHQDLAVTFIGTGRANDPYEILEYKALPDTEQGLRGTITRVRKSAGNRIVPRKGKQ